MGLIGPQYQTFNVALSPVGAKTLVDAETIVPNHLEIRNGVRTDGGFFKSRPGYDLEWNLGVAESVRMLIPFKRADTSGLGFVHTSGGRIYELRASGVSVQYTGVTLAGGFRPTWAAFDDIPIIVDGQSPTRIRVDLPGTTLDALPGSPPNGRFIAVVADRVVISGQAVLGLVTQFRWSAAGSAISWPAGNFSNVTGHGESIRYMAVKDTDLYFFKDFSVEVWAHVGGNEVFARRGIITFMDKVVRNRGLVGFTVVLGGDPERFYFYADGDFWVLDGFTPRRISGAYKRRIGQVASVSSMFAYHFPKEHVIRWFEPISGTTFVFDYVNNNWSEDNTWNTGAGEWARLPIQAFMESDDKAYIGDYEASGKIFEWSDATFQDDGVNIRLERELRILLDPKNSHKARLNRLLLRMKRGTGAIGTTPQLDIRYAFDGVDFSTSKAQSIGTATATVGEAGNYDPYVALTNLGVGREVLLELVQFAPVTHLLTHLTVTSKPLGR
jgi:hypothetical protein